MTIHRFLSREEYKAAYVQEVVKLSALMHSGASPKNVANFVLSSPCAVALSQAIEEASLPGTFAESVFNILAA